MEIHTINQALNTYINCLTFPLGIKMLTDEKELPEKVKIPSKHFKKRLTVCQSFSMSRFQGVTIALGKEDQSCPTASVFLGFREPVQYYTEGNLCDGMYSASREVGAVMEENMPRFPYNKYTHLLISPLHRATFMPDFICVYCNPAQLMRLVHGARYNKGGVITSSFTGRGECAHVIVNTIETGDYQVAILCNGERVFGRAQDFEMAFTIPVAKAEELISGLENSHNNGIRYPIPSWVNYEAAFPPSIAKLEEMWSDNNHG